MSGVKPSEWSSATITALHARLQPQACIIVETTDDPKGNGAALIAAYTAAKALLPNGAALATNNRAAVIVPPGKYDLDSEPQNAPAPTGITITPDAVGSNPVTWYYRLAYGLNDNSLRSLILNEGSFIIGDDTSEIILAGGSLPEWAEKLMIILGTTSGNYPFTVPVLNIFPSDIFSGWVDAGMGNLLPLAETIPVHTVVFTPLELDTEFVDIIGLTTDRALQHIYGTPEATNSGVIVQTANDVHISNLTVEILTEFVEEPNWDDTVSAAYFPNTNLNMTILQNCNFKGTVDQSDRLFSTRISIEYSGTYSNCTGGNYSFGDSGTASGTFNSCTGGDYSFGGNGGTASGTFTNCTGGEGAFGGNDTASGEFSYCTGGNYSFGGNGGTASGTFTNCTGGKGAFGAVGTASGEFSSCTGGNYSFGGSGTASGTFSFCKQPTEFETLKCTALSVEIAAGGTSYEVDDELTVVGGTGTAATLKVTSVNAGVIDGIEILTVGAYTALPSNPVATTGHTGDATFNITWNEGHIYGCVDSTGFIAEKNWDDPA